MKKTICYISFLLVLCACLLGLSSCASTVRQMTLFAVDGGEYTLPSRPSFVLAVGDKLQMSVSSADEKAVALYNSAGNDFYIEDDGAVLLPVLGRVALAGKTEKEAVVLLAERIQEQLREPFVTVHVTNAIVTVLGEVAAPCQIPVEQPITLAEAIGGAGGMTNNARRDNVMVQRRVGQKIKVYRINLQTDEIFASPCYYLQKGDVVYVSPLHMVNSGK